MRPDLVCWMLGFLDCLSQLTLVGTIDRIQFDSM
jgi:hypothetical protein